MLQIRPALIDDLPACRNLLSELSQATGSPPTQFDDDIFHSLISGERGRLLVADEEGTLLGMASVSYNIALRYNGEYCQLEELVVSPAARGKSVGAKLVEQTVADARARGCAEYGLYLIETTEHNRPFYEKFGFKAVGTEMRQTL